MAAVSRSLIRMALSWPRPYTGLLGIAVCMMLVVSEEGRGGAPDAKAGAHVRNLGGNTLQVILVDQDGFRAVHSHAQVGQLPIQQLKLCHQQGHLITRPLPAHHEIFKYCTSTRKQHAKVPVPNLTVLRNVQLT